MALSREVMLAMHRTHEVNAAAHPFKDERFIVLADGEGWILIEYMLDGWGIWEVKLQWQGLHDKGAK